MNFDQSNKLIKCNQYKLTNDINKHCCVCFETFNIIQKNTMTFKNARNRNIKQNDEIDICDLIDQYLDEFNKEMEETNETFIDCSLVDIEKEIFYDNIIPDDLLIKSCCNKHYICVKCIRKMINNYENHPINESNSHMSCPYPFEDCLTDIGFKNIFDHNLIRKICKTEREWQDYFNYSNRYAFPGYTIVKCPIQTYRTNGICNADILIENKLLKNSHIGELIVECTQNEVCLRKFCYNCKQQVSHYNNICYPCKTIYENENPNVFNYYFNKNSSNQINSEKINKTTIDVETISIHSDSSESTIVETSHSKDITYDESEYLFKNGEITKEEAVKQLIMLLDDVNTYMICPICKHSLYKTEKCNALSHHNLERCYACGRIGFPVKGLGDHWNTSGISGCYRFDHDTFIRNYVPEYICSEAVCSNHDRGDCNVEEHQKGIELLEKIRIKSCLYHALKSLLPELRLHVYDELYLQLQTKNDTIKIDLMPFKQTLVLISHYKTRSRDYSEQNVYKELDCEYPLNIEKFKLDKTFYIDPEIYIAKYRLKKETQLIHKPQDPTISHWRLSMEQERNNTRILQEEILPLITTNNDIIINIENDIIDNVPSIPPLQVGENTLESLEHIRDDDNIQNDDINRRDDMDITDEIIVYNGLTYLREYNYIPLEEDNDTEEL